MPKKNSYLTVTDQFCGAGGSSQGARSAGVEVKLAMNHWRLAIDTHNTNFPEADHDCADISASDPRRYRSTDILITSPECTNHTLAKGVKVAKKQMEMFNSGKLDPAAERSRATMWDVPRFAEYHNYNIIIVENVVDAKKWIMFDAWLMAMHALGYNHRCVYLNSMFCFPTPQSRDRMYVIFWKKGNPAPMLDYTPAAHCPKCEKDVQAIQTWKRPDVKWGKYKQQYVYCCPVHGNVVEPYYYASFNCINWSDIGTRIGDRSKPLSPNTERRIKYGLQKYGSQPLLASCYSPGYTKPMSAPTGAITTVDHHAVVNPFIINDQHSTGINFRVRPVSGRMDTITTNPFMKLISPLILKAEHTNQENVRTATQPFQTQTTRQTMGIVTTDAWNSFMTSYYNGSHCTKHITEESGTITTGDRMSLVTYQEPKIEDCYYRMLQAGEVKLAMAFDKDYVVLGSSRDQVKQLGNAVTPPAMEWLVKQTTATLK
jgi:DNA (cytosine-5)-methyltransferase 1